MRISLEDLFTEDQRKELCAAMWGSRPHPVGLLLSRNSPNARQIAANTNRALRITQQRNEPWVGSRKLRTRLLNCKRFHHAASALSEIRAYGYLLEAGFCVQPGPTSDFIVGEGDDGRVLIEVHAKQMDERVQATLDNHRKKVQLAASTGLGGVATLEICVQPLGAPKRQGDTALNAISRLCAIEDDESQLSDSEPSVLWVDLQDDYALSLALDEAHAVPVSAWNGALTSGALWYALYGWEGAAVFENHTDYDPCIAEMRHKGRFRQATKLSAVIASFPRATLLFEHPQAAHPLPTRFRRRLVALPWFCMGISIANWTAHQVARTIDLQAKTICALAGEPHQPPTDFFTADEHTVL